MKKEIINQPIGIDAFDFIKHLSPKTTSDQFLEILKQGQKHTLHIAIIMGYAIVQLKSKLHHGAILKGLKKISMSRRSSYQYEKIYTVFSKINSPKSIENLSILSFSKIRQLATCPAEVVSEFGESLIRVKKAKELNIEEFKQEFLPFIKNADFNYMREMEAETVLAKRGEEVALADKEKAEERELAGANQHLPSGLNELIYQLRIDITAIAQLASMNIAKIDTRINHLISGAKRNEFHRLDQSQQDHLKITTLNEIDALFAQIYHLRDLAQNEFAPELIKESHLTENEIYEIEKRMSFYREADMSVGLRFSPTIQSIA